MNHLPNMDYVRRRFGYSDNLRLRTSPFGDITALIQFSMYRRKLLTILNKNGPLGRAKASWGSVTVTFSKGVDVCRYFMDFSCGAVTR